LKHEAFRSGNFDTNFVKEHFSSPDLMADSMEEESIALQHAVDSIWSHVIEQNNQAYASREISSSWKNRME
jgi:propionyl-CoA carboxylase alpha chain